LNARLAARALSGNLTYRSEDSSLDALTALASASMGSLEGPGIGAHSAIVANRQSHLSSLGVSLIALKDAGKMAYYVRAARGLGTALGWRGIRNRAAISRQAIGEWLCDACETCRGATSVFDMHGVSVPCTACNASGKHRYSDEERSRLPGRPMQEAHGIISLAIRVAISGAIGRINGPKVP
jgi:hypothetical protein